MIHQMVCFGWYYDSTKNDYIQEKNLYQYRLIERKIVKYIHLLGECQDKDFFGICEYIDKTGEINRFKHKIPKMQKELLKIRQELNLKLKDKPKLFLDLQNE